MNEFADRLRRRAADKARMMEAANSMFHRIQQGRTPWKQSFDREDYSRTIAECADLELAARTIEDLENENATLRNKLEHKGSTNGVVEREMVEEEDV